jgi:YVTN family beta-propeller protein
LRHVHDWPALECAEPVLKKNYMKKSKAQMIYGLMSRRLFFALALLGSSLFGPGLVLGQQGNVLGTDAKLPKNTVIATVTVQAFPNQIAVSHDNSTVYVSNAGSDSVSVIDAATNTVKATFTVPSVPYYLAITPDGKTLYVASWGETGEVSVIDTTQSTYPVVTTVNAGAYSSALALSPNGRKLYVTNSGYPAGSIPGSVSVFDTATNALATTIPTNGEPFLVLFSENGRQADILNYIGTGFLQFIDTLTRKVSNSSVAGRDIFYPNGMTSDVGVTKLYITDGENYVTVCNATNGATIAKYRVVASDFDAFSLGQPSLSLNGNYLYVPYTFNDNNPAPADQVVMVDSSNGKILGTPIPVGYDPIWTQMSPNGKTLYVGNAHDGTVTVIDVTP